jgi:predicted enzyme related to lactoylglutathione lyase
VGKGNLDVRFDGLYNGRREVENLNLPSSGGYAVAPNSSMSVPRLFRVILPVTDIDRAAEFYSYVLGIPGERIWESRHYFDCGGTILACFDPRREERDYDATPNPENIYFAVSDIDAVYGRAKQAGCQWLGESIENQYWGERVFFAKDPFGNPICLVDERKLFLSTADLPHLELP